jgi:hypothetical protein
MHIDGQAFFQPPADGPLGKGSVRFAVTGIVKPYVGAVFIFGPAIERYGLCTFHVGFETAQPEQTWTLALTRPYGNSPLRRRRVYGKRSEARFIHGRSNMHEWVAFLVAARRSPMQEATVADAIRGVYTLRLDARKSLS